MAVIKFVAVLVAMTTLFATPVVHASDPDPLQDFCVADFSSKLFVNGFPCKDPANVTSEDFTYRGLRNQGNLSLTFGAPLQKAFVGQFPGLNTQGIAWARLDFAPGGLNVPHWHQRATEILSCIKGKLLVGFVDTNNRLWSSVLEAGDITMFPRGLMHFQLNVGKEVASAQLALQSQNPGRSDVGQATFGSGLRDEILEKAFGLSEKAVESLKEFFDAPHLQDQSPRSDVEVM